MGKAKNLLEEAIAEAKVVRAAAIKNATKQLEENLTPSIKEMLAKKLEEELDLNENEEENLEENSNSGFKEVKMNEAEDDDADADAEDADADAADADAAADDADAAAEDADADADAADADADAADAAAEGDDEAADDETPLKDITLGDLKNIISDLVAAAAAPAPGGDMGADMDPGDVEGMGDENPDAAVDALPADAPADAPADGDAAADPAAGDDEDEIDISEILRELEEEEKGNKEVCPKCGQPKGSAACKEMCKENKQNDEMPENQNGKEHHKEPNENGPSQDSELDEVKKENEELKKENQELKEGLQKCYNTLKEVNTLNTKLKVTTKLLSKTGLTESQKANIIRTVDGAKNAKEAVALGKTLLEGLKNTKKPLTEGRKGSASKPAGSSTAPKKTENQMIDEGMVYRFQQLAGIIKD
jgi:hypothetical protein